MFQAILYPFDGPLHDPGAHRQKDDIGKYTLLDAETASRIGRRAKAQAVSWHAESSADNGVDGERALKISQHIIAVFEGIVFREYAIGFKGRA